MEYLYWVVSGPWQAYQLSGLGVLRGVIRDSSFPCFDESAFTDEVLAEAALWCYQDCDRFFR